MGKVVCFDLEGTLSSLSLDDHMLSVTAEHIKDGRELFQALSRHTDKPGDVLRLVAPFLAANLVTGLNLKSVSSKTNLVAGSRELIESLQERKWKVFVMSTSCEQHTLDVCGRLGVPENNVFYTKYPLDACCSYIVEEREEIEEIEFAKELILNSENEKEIGLCLEELQRNQNVRAILQAIEVMDDSRKVQVLNEVSKRTETPLKEMAVVGNAVTANEILNEVKKKQGLAIAFNSDLLHATIGVTASDLMDLRDVLSFWGKSSNREALKSAVKKKKFPCDVRWIEA